jgi:protein gp37
VGENTKIAWAHHTFNGWIGCTQVAPECEHCYAEVMAKFRGWASWGEGQPRKRTTEENWKKPVRWNREAVENNTQCRVFSSSLSDVFDPEVPPQWRADLFELIRHTPNLDWLLLTKRPAQMRDYLNRLPGAPWPNIWALVSAGCQKTANSFVPILLDTKAAVRGVSCEPILEPVDFSAWMKGGRLKSSKLDWIIVGDESGHHPRRSEINWYRRIRRQCNANGVAFFLKQFCDARGRKTETPELDGQRWIEFPPTSANREMVVIGQS